MKKKQQNVVYGYFDDVPHKEILNTGSESKVQHHQAETCDMKVILNKFLKTGDPVHLNQRQKRYLDCTLAQDYDQSLQTVIDAQEAFYSLPSKVRERFHNDPKEMLEFVNNKDNLDEAIELGLAERKPNESSSQGDLDNQQTKESIVADSPLGRKLGDDSASVAKQHEA